MDHTRTLVAALGGLLPGAALSPVPLHSQGYPFSERGSVTQKVAFTEFSVEFGRPVARGRARFGARATTRSGSR
jgi:hypothetical protein